MTKLCEMLSNDRPKKNQFLSSKPQQHLTRLYFKKQAHTLTSEWTYSDTKLMLPKLNLHRKGTVHLGFMDKVVINSINKWKDGNPA